jgi:hypothetical protein
MELDIKKLQEGMRQIMGNVKKSELLKYVGDTSQLFGIKDYRINGGRADGVRALDVINGSGLEYTVLADRALDIAKLSYKGLNMSYMSKTGIVAPQYFNEKGKGFLRSFYGGFLTTCGLTYMGAPCNDNGDELGLHGRISNTPAEEVSSSTEWKEDSAIMSISGKIRETGVFAENLVLEREIKCAYGENLIYINDTVENIGFNEEPIMILYHFNLGYPLLSSKSYITVPSAGVIPRDNDAKEGMDEYKNFHVPTHGYKEQVFYHEPVASEDGNTYAALVNPVQKTAVVIRFNTNQLPKLIEWKMMGEGEYVLGLEPANCYVEGRAKARKDGTLKFIKPGEKKKFNIIVEILEGEDINKLD